MLHRLLAALFALLLSVTLAAASLPAWGSNSFSSAQETLLTTLSNQARATAGLPALLTDATLTGIARTRAKYIHDHEWGYHCAYPTTTCTTKMYVTLVNAAGYCYRVIGENLGYNNFPDDQTAQWMFDWFMGSPTHRANILGMWTNVGVGAYKGNDPSSIYWHVFVMIFAVRCPTYVPPPLATPRPSNKPTIPPAIIAKPLPSSCVG